MADQFGWMPGFLKRFLNLDDDAPAAGGSTGSYRPGSTGGYQPSRASSTYTPPAPPPLPPPSFDPAPRAAESNTPRSTTGDTQGGSWRRTDTPTFLKPSDVAKPPSPDSSSGDSASFNGFETIGSGVRGYVRGVLPPQGVEAFTKEARHTVTGLWGLYSRIIGDQVGSIAGMGKELLDAVADTAQHPEGASTPLRRIKVMAANGNGDSHK